MVTWCYGHLQMSVAPACQWKVREKLGEFILFGKWSPSLVENNFNFLFCNAYVLTLQFDDMLIFLP